VEFRIRYERRISKSIGLVGELGYKIPNGQNRFTDATFFVYYPYSNPVATWYHATLGMLFYMGKKERFYISTELYYTYKFYENKLYVTANMPGYYCGSYTADIKQTSYLNNIGAKMLFCFKIPLLKPHHKVIPYVEPYFGAGLRYKYELIIEHSKRDCHYQELEPETYFKKGLYPILHGGFRIGVSF